MNLHITPSFNIDRLCKTASVLLFLVKVIFRGHTMQGLVYDNINEANATENIMRKWSTCVK